jgi:hypothetical protein
VLRFVQLETLAEVSLAYIQRLNSLANAFASTLALCATTTSTFGNMLARYFKSCNRHTCSYSAVQRNCS